MSQLGTADESMTVGSNNLLKVHNTIHSELLTNVQVNTK